MPVQRDQLGHVGGVAEKPLVARKPIPQCALAGVVTDTQKEINVVQPAGSPSLVARAETLRLLDQPPTPAIWRPVGEGANQTFLVLGS